MHSKLPHINYKEYYQFITFRTQDSIDEYVSKIQNNSKINNKTKEFEIDKYLDVSKKGAYLNGDNLKILKDIILSKNNIMYEVEILAIMPNHVHILFKQLDDLKSIMKYIKGKSAVEINKNMNRSGKFWLHNYYDKAIRNQSHYDIVYNYIENNPIKAGLNDCAQRVYSRY